MSIEDWCPGLLLLDYDCTFSFPVLSFQPQKTLYPTSICSSSVAPLLSPVMFHFSLLSLILFFSLNQILLNTHMFEIFFYLRFSYPCTLISSLFHLWVCYAVSQCCPLMSTSDSVCISRLFSNHIQFLRDLISSFFFFMMCSWYIIRYLKGKLYFIFAVLKQAIILLTSSFYLKVTSDGSWNISGLCLPLKKGDRLLQNLILLFRKAESSRYGFVGRGTESFLGSLCDDCWICFQLHKKWRSCLKYLKELPSLHLLWTFSPHSYITFSFTIFLCKLLLVLFLIKSWFILQLCSSLQDFPSLLLF